MEYLGVKQNFSVDILLNALYEMKQQYKDTMLPSDCQAVVRLILPELSSYMLRAPKIIDYVYSPYIINFIQSSCSVIVIVKL